MWATFLHKLKVLKNLQWTWAFRFYRKRFKMYFFYTLDRWQGKKFLPVTITGTKILLGFKRPYHHLYARSLARHQHEFTLLALFKHYAALLPEQSVIFDFGAYNGMYGLLAGAVNTKAKIYIVEADPANGNEIEANVQLNAFSNITVKQVAIAGQSGKTKFSLHDSGTAGKCTTTGNYEVTCVSLSDLLAGYTPSACLLKFDVLGAEYDSLMQAKELLARIPTVYLLLEFYPVSNEAEALFWQTFAELGFTVVYLYPRGDGGSIYYWLEKK